MIQHRLGSALLTLSTLLTTLSAATAFAQTQTTENWPNKPIRVIVPFAPGSFTDTAARSVGAELSAALGQPIVVENKGGAGSTLGTDVVAKAAPDGYTFLVTDNSFAVSAALYDKLAYQPKDLIQVSILADAPAVLVARPNLPTKTLKETIEAARAHPGQMTFGSGGQGSSAHLAMENFLLQNKVEMVHIPFKGIAAAVIEVAADRVDLAIGSIGSTAGFIKDGRLMGLAVSGERRQDIFPNVPTFAQAGYPDYQMMYWFGMMAPTGTPPAVVARMQKEIAKAVTSQKVKDVFGAAGVRPIANTPAEFSTLVQNETKLWTDVIQRAKIKQE